VLVQHCLEFTPVNDSLATASSPFEYIFANGFNLGRFGVIIFFLISGFLIPSSIVNQSRPLIGFAIGRFARLYPLYWLSIALALVTLAALGKTVPGHAQVAANMTMFQTLFGYENILDPYWTLLIEQFFYFLCVSIFLAGALNDLPRMRWIMFAGGLLLILLASALMFAPQMRYAKHLSYFMYTGSFLFVMIVGHNIRLTQALDGFRVPTDIIVLFVTVFGFIVAARQEIGGYNILLSPVSVFLSSVAALLVFLSALHWRAFISAPFVFLGKISYGLYLFHGIALWIAIELTGRPSDLWHSLCLFGLVCGFAVAAATLAFFFLEEPFIALGKVVRRGLGSGTIRLEDRTV
jgi:peptidoglycan/LPS O-acetylase OafA/YrhL